jgi:alpha,alpha-trehalase
VLSDLGQLELAKEDQVSTAIAPLALERLVEIRTRIRNRRVAVFLDYDGTLTPIVERPELAVMSADMRATLKALADCCTVVVISGRERGDVQRLVGLNNVIYAGCHGFDIAGPRDTKIQHEEGAGYVPVLAQAAHELHRRLAPIEGAIVENKTYAVAVHFRLVKAEDLGRVEHAVDSVLAQHSLLRKTSGKKVFELRPNLNWDKGKAVLWLLDALSLNEADLVPIYLGDDVTDRDAFCALHGKGISILVADQPQATCADYRLSDTAEVRAFLNELTAIRSESEANE